MHIYGERKQFIRYTEFGKSEEREISDFTSSVGRQSQWVWRSTVKTSAAGPTENEQGGCGEKRAAC